MLRYATSVSIGTVEPTAALAVDLGDMHYSEEDDVVLENGGYREWKPGTAELSMRCRDAGLQTSWYFLDELPLHTDDREAALISPSLPMDVPQIGCLLWGEANMCAMAVVLGHCIEEHAVGEPYNWRAVAAALMPHAQPSVSSSLLLCAFVASRRSGDPCM